jgi:tetratricopeptide (TPR) repeat protein
MNTNPYRQNREELRELLHQYDNLKTGRNHSFIEEDSFEIIIDYFDQREELSNAIEAVGFAIELYPYSSNLLLKKADLLIASKKFQEALSFLHRAELLDNTDSNLYILKTDAYLALDKQEKAATVLENAINHFEGEEKIELLYELSDVYDDYEHFDKVFDCLQLILELNPNEEEALHKICFWTDFTGRNEEGIRIQQKIIEAFPFNELAWFNLGSAYQGIKLYEKAIDSYLYAVAIDEKFDYAYRNLGDAYLRIRKYKEAIEVLQKVLELARPEELIYEALAHCYDKLNKFAQARLFYRKATHLNPDNSQLFFKIACTYMNESAWESAIKNLQTAMLIYKMQPEYNLAMGQCYMEIGNIESAIQYFGYVVKHRPKNINGWLELLKCLYKADFFEQGAEYVDHALFNTNEKPVFFIYKCAFLLSLGKSKEAMLQLEYGLTKNPKLIKKLIELNPTVLQNQQIIDVVVRFKNRKV